MAVALIINIHPLFIFNPLRGWSMTILYMHNSFGVGVTSESLWILTFNLS